MSPRSDDKTAPKPTAGDWAVYLVGRPLMLLFRLFSLSFALRMARAVGRLVGPLLPAKRRILDNLDLLTDSYQPPDRDWLVREASASIAQLAMEYTWLDRIAARPDLLTIEGGQHFQNAAAAGKGIVLVSAHFGNWELARIAAAGLGHPSGIIYRRFDNPLFDARAQRTISPIGEPVLQKGVSGMRDLVRHVRKGGVMLILVDQRAGGEPLLPFLGRGAETALAPAALAAKTGAALMPVRAMRSQAGYEVRFETPVAADRPEAMMSEVNDRISAWIRETPEQWFWFHRRWKTRPGAAPPTRD